jgi:hypothetical protein
MSDPVEELKKLGDQFNILIICPVERLQDDINGILKFLAARGMPGVYVSISKPYKNLARTLTTNGVDIGNISFIDCISHSADDGVKEDDGKVTYVSNVGDLSAMGMCVHDLVERIPGREFILIDALETLLIYNKPETIAMFVQSIIEKASKSESSVVILTPNGDKALIDRIGMFFDRIVEVK